MRITGHTAVEGEKSQATSPYSVKDVIRYSTTSYQAPKQRTLNSRRKP